MRRLLASSVLTLLLALPAHAQTTRWSDNLVLPSPGRGRAAPAPVRPQASPPGYTQQWSAPTYTRRRTDAENREIVGRMSERARRDAQEGRGAGLNRYQGSSAPGVPDRVWRDHLARDRANEAFQRNQDAYYSRQR